MSRYCKGCKHMVQEKHLWNGNQCPTCGVKLEAPLSFRRPKTTDKVVKSFDILVEYNDKVTGELKTIVYTDVTEEYYNKIRFMAKNVVKVTTLTKEV